jgi:hypothetical protein
MISSLIQSCTMCACQRTSNLPGGPESFYVRFCSWIAFKVPLELLATVLLAKCTTFKSSFYYAFPDLTARTTRKESPASAASIAIRDVSSLKVHPIEVATCLSYLSSHRLLLERVLLQSRQMNGASTADQTTISNHRVHRFILAATGIVLDARLFFFGVCFASC